MQAISAVRLALNIAYNRSHGFETDPMTTLFSHDAYHDDVGHAFNELLLMEQLSRVPEASLVRILQSFPAPLLKQALEPAAGDDQRSFPKPCPR